MGELGSLTHSLTHLASATDPIESLLLALGRRTQSVCCFKLAYILNQVPTRAPPALPHHALSSHRRPHSNLGGLAAVQNKTTVPLPAGVRTDVSVTRDTQDRQPTHHCHSARRHWLFRELPRHSTILNSYFHNQGQSPDNDLRVQLTRPPSALQPPNHATQNPPR